MFDYWDDANLTVAQYYITELIADYQRQGRAIYPIILTHLNPAFFKNYVFSKQNVIYLDKSRSFDSCDAMKKLIAARNDGSVGEATKNNISKYLVHYHVDEFDFSTDLQTINGTRPSWGKRGKFQAFIEEEFNKYKNNAPYDPLAICAITRRTIEEFAFMGLTSWENAHGGKIIKTDVVVAKNYLSREELDSLGRIVNSYLDLAEDRARRNIPMTMEDWAKRLDAFLEFAERDVLQDAGKISAEMAKAHAESEFEKYRIVQDRLFESDFDRAVKQLEVEHKPDDDSDQ